MPLFSIINCSSELDEISPYISPWVILKKFLQFSNTYGDYHSLPPSRRQFLINKERCNQAKKNISKSWLYSDTKQDSRIFFLGVSKGSALIFMYVLGISSLSSY